MNYKASDVDGSWAVNALHETIKEFNEQSSEQIAQMLWLTKVMAALTVVMLLGLLVQIYLAIWPPAVTSTQTERPGVITPSSTAPQAQQLAPQSLPQRAPLAPIAGQVAPASAATAASR